MTVKNRRAFELRLGKVGLIAFIGGMSVLLFSFFLLGVIVGKQMEAYPERYSSGVSELIRDRVLAAVSKQEKVASPEADQKDGPAEGGADFGLTFYDTLGGKKGGAAAGVHAGAAKHRPSDNPSARASPAGSAADTGPPAAKPGRTAGETVPRVPVGAGEGTKLRPIPAGTSAGEGGTPKPPAGETDLQGEGRFEVQVAAYRERLQAERLAKKIAAIGYAPRVVMKELPGKGRWFRVIVGDFGSRGTAQEAADQITGKIRGLKYVIRSADRDGNGG